MPHDQDLCSSFRSLSEKTWRTLYEARKTGVRIGEEGTTERLLLYLSLHHNKSEIFIQQFNKKEESLEGADWEWWFIGSGGDSLGFRIQAKIIDLKTDTYPHLHYQLSKSKQFQLDILIEKALQSPPYLIPLVCLYSHVRLLNKVISWPCLSFPRRAPLYGCSVMSAFHARALRTKQDPNSVRAVLPHARPWHCMVCCRGYGGKTLPQRAYSYWSKQILPIDINALEASVFDNENNNKRELPDLIKNYINIKPLDHIPDRVAIVIDGRIPQENNENLAGMVIVRETESGEVEI